MPPITPLAPPVAPTAPSRMRSPEAIAAQRAFFNAALGKTEPQATAAPVATVKAAVETPAPQFDPTASPPSRLLRPGSLIDIKV